MSLVLMYDFVKASTSFFFSFSIWPYKTWCYFLNILLLEGKKFLASVNQVLLRVVDLNGWCTGVCVCVCVQVYKYVYVWVSELVLDVST